MYTAAWTIRAYTQYRYTIVTKQIAQTWSIRTHCLAVECTLKIVYTHYEISSAHSYIMHHYLLRASVKLQPRTLKNESLECILGPHTLFLHWFSVSQFHPHQITRLHYSIALTLIILRSASGILALAPAWAYGLRLVHFHHVFPEYWLNYAHKQRWRRGEKVVFCNITYNP